MVTSTSLSDIYLILNVVSTSLSDQIWLFKYSLFYCYTGS
jgi:hypothetical protein